MTRGNINFISQKRGEAPKTLFVYHDGDQYPSGIRDHFHVLDFTSGDFTPERFKDWVKTNYGQTPRSVAQPKIYYTDGFITDYSYVFDAGMSEPTVMVYEWDKQIFKGNPDKFKKWIEKQE